MDPTPAEPPPGCLVLLLNLSAGMTADVVTPRGESPAFVAARFLADELLEGLVTTAAAGYSVGPIDIAVLGYRTTEAGAPQLFSVLPDADPKPRFVPLSGVANLPAEVRGAEGQPRKWAVLPACEGEPCPTAALARTYQMVSVWLTGRYSSRPPVVIHCTTDAAVDEAYLRVARSLELLATVYGPVRLMHYVFGGHLPEGKGERGRPTPNPSLQGGENEPRRAADVIPSAMALPDSPSLQGGGWGVGLPFSPVPGSTRAQEELGLPGRVFVNEWDITDPWDAIFTHDRLEAATAWTEAGAALRRVCAMWAPKMGNTPEQWEDAFAIDEATGAAAVADGASTGIYCSIWAQQLSQRFLSDRPDARDPVFLNKWVNGLRTEWRTAINYNQLNWSKQAKVDQVGAAATLLGLELGPADETGARPWRACAVGDASLFWVRAGKLLATFPVVAADQFGSAPLLIRSNPGFKTVAVAAAGTCEPDDRFVLATDAVAARLCKSTASGAELDWARFEALDEEDWRAELDALRRGNDMVNDDCTLVVLRVTGGEDVLALPIGDELPETLDAVPPAPLPSNADDFIAAGAGDLMIDLPPAPPVPDGPEATGFGFPEGTDPGI